MRMTRIVAVPAIASLALVAGCGGSKSSSSSAASSSSSSTQSAAAGSSDSAGSSANSSASGDASSSASASDSSTDCPTDGNTRSFAKTRFVADLGLAAGTFHRYVYKPYQAGTFKKGANGRITALAKAGATAALDIHLLKNAQKNVKASPALCKALAKPMSDAMDKLKNMKTDAMSGNFASITAANTLFGDIASKAKSNGAEITENDNLSDAQKAADQG